MSLWADRFKASTEPTSVADYMRKSDPSNANPLTNLPANRLHQIKEFRARADDLINRANFVLTIIIGVLIFSGIFVIFGGAIAQIGATRRDPISDLMSERDKLSNQIEQDISALATARSTLLSEQAKKAKGDATNTDAQQTSTGQNFTVGRYRPVPQTEAAISAMADEINAEIQSSRDTLKLFDQSFVEFEKSNVNRSLGDQDRNSLSITDPRLLLAAFVTRFGVALIAIYLVQILISLYRFNTRMAAFYRAQADALTLYDHDADVISKKHQVLQPVIDYGRMSNTVVDRALEAVANALGQAQKKITATRRRIVDNKANLSRENNRVE